MKTINSKNCWHVVFVLLLACGLLALNGCATTERTKSVETSGFLGDYSLLKHGGENEASLYYIDPSVDFKQYDKIVIDPVTIWRTENSKGGEIPEEEQMILTAYLYEKIKESLSEDYKIVEVPETGTMRVRIALTEASGASVPGKVVTTYMPPGIIISTATRMATGTYSFVGSAAVEIEVLDIVTHKRLAAAVDKRAGGRNIKVDSDPWGDTKRAMDRWAELIQQRFESLRNR